jgi:hypothetical protein
MVVVPCASTFPSRSSTLASLEISCRPRPMTRASARTRPASLVMGRAKLTLVSIVVQPEPSGSRECPAQMLWEVPPPARDRHGRGCC